MRVVVYARVSTEHEAQINALENQLEWYKIEGSRHSDWEINDVYVDQGITGTQAQKRPEFLPYDGGCQKRKIRSDYYKRSKPFCTKYGGCPVLYP